MPENALYTDLSGYYDLMCVHIDYPSQSNNAHRLNQIFGNGGKQHIDLACGTGLHISHFNKEGYQSSGLDINQPMLDIAKQRCPDAQFILGNMCAFDTSQHYDLITCFLYSIHYSGDITDLKSCIQCVHKALNPGGVFCFNSVDKTRINNKLSTNHKVMHDNSQFSFGSSWYYRGEGDKQTLKLSIEKTNQQHTLLWTDEHPMVAIQFTQLQALLMPYFDVHIFEHDHNKILPWDKLSGNAIFICIKK